MRDDLIAQYGDEMGLWLAKRVGNYVRGKENLSHFSIVEVPTGLKLLSPEAWRAVRRHEEKRSGGCCGSLDVEITHYSGRKFRLGFNYGH
jgi:hypothetical protein